MLPAEIAARKAQWARFRVWEADWKRGAPPLDPAEVVRAVGEVIEFYLTVSGGSASPGRPVTEKVQGIRRLQHELRLLTRPG